MGHIQLDSPQALSWARAAFAPTRVLRCDGRTLRTTLSGDEERTWDDPLAALEWMAQEGGEWVGYLSYDLGRLFEELPATAEDDLGLPLFCFAADSHPERTREGSGLEVRGQIPREYARNDAALLSTFSRERYLAAVARTIEYIRAGDVFQVNLSQRFTAPLPASPLEVYRRLPPAHYGALLDFGDHALISNSPELFLRVTPDRKIVTRPIKGTRPRAPRMKHALRDSIKDQAELNMIIDLERNDLGRVCEIGSVKVTQPRVIETHPTVYHGAATVEGVLRPDVGFVELLRATFPGGSITGAPKIRAMQIIEELEPVRRGPYCGAIGYISADGHMEFNIAIRTMIVKDGLVHVPVGGGIVADSTPGGEYEETLVKAKAMLGALGVGGAEMK